MGPSGLQGPRKVTPCDCEKHEGTNGPEYCAGTTRGLLATELPPGASTHLSNCFMKLFFEDDQKQTTAIISKPKKCCGGCAPAQHCTSMTDWPNTIQCSASDYVLSVLCIKSSATEMLGAKDAKKSLKKLPCMNTLHTSSQVA